MGRGEHVGARAVVLLQLHDPGAGEVLVEVEDVADVGAPPAVDGLVVVAHHAHVGLGPAQEPEQPVLGRVRVLELVDEQVPEASAPAPAQLAVRLEQLGRPQKQVPEVHGAGAGERPLVAAPKLEAALRLDVVVVEPDVLRRQAQVLPAIDAREHLARPEAAVVREPHLGEEALRERPLVVVVVDGEGRRQAGPGGLAPEEARPEGVEGLYPGLAPLRAEQRLEPLPHLACGLVGEGDGEHVPGQRRRARGRGGRCGGR